LTPSLSKPSDLKPSELKPSDWFEANRGRLEAVARRGPILDLACGRGRHALAAARAGWRTVALDRNGSALAEMSGASHLDTLSRVRADVAHQHGIPFREGTFSAILVFRFLFRPLAAQIEAVLQPGGLLIYETFTRAQRSLGWGPTRAAYLLREDELPSLFPGLTVIASEACTTQGERPEAVARLAAVKPR
jgi:SAM-dependent methyltransferase